MGQHNNTECNNYNNTGDMADLKDRDQGSGAREQGTKKLETK